MQTMRNLVLALLIGVGSLFAAAGPGESSTFHGWRVTDVPPWDTLNVRAYPSPQSDILVAYPNGTMLSLTGVCTKGLHLDAIAGQPAWQQRQHVRYRWCQIWVDPQGNGAFQTAWVYGRYLSPA